MKDFGATQYALAEKLTEAFRQRGKLRVNRTDFIHPSDFNRARGYWTHQFQDVMRWTLWIELDGCTRSVGCWETMTKCVRNGFDIHEDDGRNYADFMVDAKPRRRKK